MKTLVLIVGMFIVQGIALQSAEATAPAKAKVAVKASKPVKKTEAAAPVPAVAEERAPASAPENVTCYAANDRTYVCDGGLYVACHGRIGNCDVMPPNLQFNQSIETDFSTTVQRGNWNALESFFEEKAYERSKRSPASN